MRMNQQFSGEWEQAPPPAACSLPHAGQHGAAGPTSSPRPGDGLIYRYASAPEQFEGDTGSLPPSTIPLAGPRLIVRSGVFAPGTPPESLNPGAPITPDGKEMRDHV